MISDVRLGSLVDGGTSTNIPKDNAVSIFSYPENGHIRLLQNISIHLPDYTVLHPRRL